MAMQQYHRNIAALKNKEMVSSTKCMLIYVYTEYFEATLKNHVSGGIFIYR